MSIMFSICLAKNSIFFLCDAQNRSQIVKQQPYKHAYKYSAFLKTHYVYTVLQPHEIILAVPLVIADSMLVYTWRITGYLGGETLNAAGLTGVYHSHD